MDWIPPRLLACPVSLNFLEVYHLNINSNKRALLSVIPVFLLFITTLVTFPDVGSIVFIAIFILFGFLAYATASLCSIGKIDATFTHSSIEFQWAKKFLLSKEPNYSIPYSEIIHYQYESLPQYDWIKLILTNKRQFVLSRLDLPINFRKPDNFEQFVQDLPQIIKEKSHQGDVVISEGPTIYDDKIFRWALYVMTAISIFFIYDLVTNPTSSFSWPKIALIVSNVFFLLMNFRRTKN